MRPPKIASSSNWSPGIGCGAGFPGFGQRAWGRRTACARGAGSIHHTEARFRGTVSVGHICTAAVAWYMATAARFLPPFEQLHGGEIAMRGARKEGGGRARGAEEGAHGAAVSGADGGAPGAGVRVVVVRCALLRRLPARCHAALLTRRACARRAGACRRGRAGFVHPAARHGYTQPHTRQRAL